MFRILQKILIHQLGRYAESREHLHAEMSKVGMSSKRRPHAYQYERIYRRHDEQGT